MKRSLLVCVALLGLLVGCGEQGADGDIFGREQVIACPPAEALEVAVLEHRAQEAVLLVGADEERYSLRYAGLTGAGLQPENIFVGDTLYLTLVELPEDGEEIPRVLTAEIGARGICGTMDVWEDGDAYSGE